VPWSADHLVGVVVANGVGLVLVFVGWWESSGLGSAHQQLAWLNLGVVGLIIAGGANGLWLARSRRVVTLARAVVLPYPPGSGAWPAPSSNGRASHAVVAPARGRRFRASADGAGTGVLVAGSAMSFFHRADCLLMAGKEVRVAGRADHERAGRAACEVCRP
jgi:hypothetical protein